MSHDPQHDPKDRDQIIARLAAEALRTGAASGGETGPGGETGVCPDAELLAAYADHSLAATETARWESHFADCARCRKILAGLAVSEQLLATQEAQAPGRRIVAVPSPASVAHQPVVMRPRRMPRWLVPTLGAAVAAMLWFALRPATTPSPDLVSQAVPPGNSVSPDVPPADLTAPVSPFSDLPDANSSSPSASSEIAQGNVPPSPTSTFRDEVPGQGAPGQSLGGNSVFAPRLEQEVATRQLQESAATAAAPESLTAADSARAPARIVTPAAPREQLLVAPPSDALAAAKTAPPAAASQNTAPADSQDGQRSTQTQTFSAVATRGLLGTLARTATPTFTFAAPGGTQWRAGTGGLIERSLDQGRTWQAQASGVTLDLAAGSATSNQVAWIVGHAGVILRTTDGVSWQRVFSPNASTLDWIGVQATDALHATIVSKDQRRFTTADGGQNWTAQP